MAVLQEIRDIFEDEIEGYLTRLRRHSRQVSAAAAVDSSTSAAWERDQMSAVKRLATEMTNGVMRRLEQNTDIWVLSEGAAVDARGAEDATAAEVQRATDAENATVRQLATERCRELEAQLRRKLEEERQCSAELLRQFEVSYSERLTACDQELHRLRQEASFQPSGGRGADAEQGAGGSGGGRSVEAANSIRRDFVEYMERIRRNIDTAKDLVSRLDTEQRELEGFEQQQKRGLSDIELVLAGAPYDGEDGDDTADRNLLELIRQGEQVCKRMRLHVDEVA